MVHIHRGFLRHQPCRPAAYDERSHVHDFVQEVTVGEGMPFGVEHDTT